MHTTKNPDNTWTCFIRLNGIVAVCEANRRREARQGALSLVLARIARRAAQ